MITIFNIRPKGFNVGNDAIYIGMQYYLYQAFGEVVNIITLPATSRYESKAKAGLTNHTVYEINQYGHGVIIGGGNLYENGEIELNLDALKALDVPLMLFSLSRGRVYNRRHELVARTDALPDRVLVSLHERANYSLARDNATYDYLRQLGCEGVKVGGCPTIFLDRTAAWLPQLPQQEKEGVLISIRNPQMMNIPLHKKAQVHSDVIGIIDFLKAKGYSDIRLLCHDQRDISFAASIPNIEFIYTGDVYSYLALLRRCSLIVTYRLHSALPCLAYGRPFIKISYDERAISLMETIGYDEWDIKMLETNDVLGEIEDRFERLQELPLKKEAARARWKILDDTMTLTFRQFAGDVINYKNMIERH
jgi:polysaccharide pyruvyl transferase WcaK-like protein